MRSPLRRFRLPREAYDWAEITSGQEDGGKLDDSITDYTDPETTHFGLPGSPEITPPRRVEVDQLGRRKLVRTDVDETKGRPYRPTGPVPGDDTYCGPNIFYSA